MINQKTLNNLEYYKIIEMLKNNCITFKGKELAQNLIPLCDIEKVKYLQQETSESCSYSLRKNNPPISPIPDLENITNKINKHII